MTASRPARAMRGAAVLAALAIAWRIPVMQHEFAAALATGAEPAARPRPTVPKRSATQIAALVTFATPAGDPSPSPGAGVALPATAVRSRIRPGSLPAAMPVATLAPATRAPAGGGATATDDRKTSPSAEKSPAAITAFDLATAAYARLAAGDRRGAVRLFDAALALADPRSGPWQAQRDALTRRWSASAYSIVRAGGTPAAAVTPVLGGGQSGAGVAFTPDPLAARPVAATLRGSLAHDDSGRTAFAAVGVQWRPLPGVTVAAERLIGVGPAARDEWTARVAVGADRRYHRLRLTTYAEGGVIGSAGYAAAQARIGPEFHVAGIAVVPGLGGWASVQRDHGRTVDRLDLGPGVAVRAGPLAAALDYRVRAVGNAAPGSGPVLTLSAAF